MQRLLAGLASKREWDEVLNDLGVVIKVVPRELTDEEREVHDARELLEEQARAEEERLRKWDESLLLRYSTVEDIEAARERAAGGDGGGAAWP